MRSTHRRVLALVAALAVAGCGAAPASPSATGTASSSPSVSNTPASPTEGPTVAPTPAPTSTLPPPETPGPTPTTPPATAEPPSATVPPAPPFDRVSLTTDGPPVPAARVGGCGSLWLGAAVYGTDSCGPWLFPLKADPVSVKPGGTLTFAAPDGYTFSVDAISTDPYGATLHPWAVTIAPLSALEGLPDTEQTSLSPANGGRSLGHGDRAVISAWVKAPVTPGEYLVQLEAPLNRGSWTWTWPIYFWRVSVG